MRCRLDAKNARRYASASNRAANVAGVQRHRERLRVVDPFRRYFLDAARTIIRTYAEAGRRLPRDAVMVVFRDVEQCLREPNLVRQKVRDLIRVAQRDALRQRTGRLTSDG